VREPKKKSKFGLKKESHVDVSSQGAEKSSTMSLKDESFSTHKWYAKRRFEIKS